MYLSSIGGGLLGCEILPWMEGDEEEYEVFEITRDTPCWKPRQFREEEEDPIVAIARLLLPQNLTGIVKPTLLPRQFPAYTII